MPGPAGADAELLTRLVDAASLWVFLPGSDREPVVRAACDLVADGVDGGDGGNGSALVDLAAVSVHSSEPGFGDLVEAALLELGLVCPAPGTDAAAIGALRAKARLVVVGDLPPRDLAAWAHHHVGHDGPREASRLVEADDEYDTAEYRGLDPATVDDAVVAEARRLLAEA